jgi:hypothetical protein
MPLQVGIGMGLDEAAARFLQVFLCWVFNLGFHSSEFNALILLTGK